jgi:hypothetical protein
MVSSFIAALGQKRRQKAETGYSKALAMRLLCQQRWGLNRKH